MPESSGPDEVSTVPIRQPSPNSANHDRHSAPQEHVDFARMTATQRHSGVFGLKKNYGRQYNSTNINAYDYESKYAEDAYGEECGPDARVWHVYLDEAGRIDWEKIGDWKDNIDVILVFAGLFSAIVTAFVLESHQALKSDDTPRLLLELISVQRSMAQGNNASDIPSVVASFAPAPQDVWVNGLWFASLGLSVSTAFLAMLTKQWLQQYLAVGGGSRSPRERSRLRQFRNMGLNNWMVDVIIDCLPIIMYIAVACFLAGLVIFLYPLHPIIAVLSGVIAGSTYLFYFVTTLLSTIYLQCPYKTPLSHYTYVLLRGGSYMRTATTFMKSVPGAVRTMVSRLCNTHFGQFDLDLKPESIILSIHHFWQRWRYWVLKNAWYGQAFSAAEMGEVRSRALLLDTHVLDWLLHHSSHHTGVSIAFQAAAGLPEGVEINLQPFTHLVNDTAWTPEQERQAERYLRIEHTSELVSHTPALALEERILKNCPDPTFEGHHHLRQILPFLQSQRDSQAFLACISGFMFGDDITVEFPSRVWSSLLQRWLAVLPAAPRLNVDHPLILSMAAAFDMAGFVPCDRTRWISAKHGVAPLSAFLADEWEFASQVSLECLYHLFKIAPLQPEHPQESQFRDSLALCLQLAGVLNDGRVFEAIQSTLATLRYRILDLSPIHAKRDRLIAMYCSALMDILAVIRFPSNGNYLHHRLWVAQQIHIALRMGGPAVRTMGSHPSMPQTISQIVGWTGNSQGENLASSTLTMNVPMSHGSMVLFVYDVLQLLLEQERPQLANSTTVFNACSDPVTLETLSLPSRASPEAFPNAAKNHGQVIQAYIQCLVELVTTSPQEGKEAFDNLHSRPDTLQCICKALIVQQHDSDFRNLLSLDPNHAVWIDQAEVLRAWITGTVGLDSGRSGLQRRDKLLRMLNERQHMHSHTRGPQRLWFSAPSWIRKAYNDNRPTV